jgi:hypothetical protein
MQEVEDTFEIDCGDAIPRISPPNPQNPRTRRVWRASYGINGKSTETSYPGEFADFCEHLKLKKDEFLGRISVLTGARSTSGTRNKGSVPRRSQ